MGNEAMIVVERSPGDVVAEGTATYYASLSDVELEKIVCDLFNRAERGVLHYTREMRAELLPALMALKKRTPRGQWQERLRRLGLSSNRVRQWKFRDRESARELRTVLGDPRIRRRPQQRAEDTESESEMLLKAADRMAKALRGGNISYAKRLAKEYLEARDIWDK